MKVLLTGANGMLGTRLTKKLKNEKIDLLGGKKDLDLTDLSELSVWLKDKHYSTIIHTAAFTDLKFCDLNEKKANILHAEILSLFNEHSDKLIYVSTVPIWSQKNYQKNVYYETKRNGENIALQKKDNLVLRTNIFGDRGLVGWAYKTAGENTPVNGYENSIFNPVHVEQMSSIIKEMIYDDSCGIVSVSSNVVLSKLAFLEEIFQLLELDKSLLKRYILNRAQDLTIKKADFVLPFEEGKRLLRDDFKNR